MADPLPRVFRAKASDNRWGLVQIDRQGDTTEILAANPNRVVVRTSGEEPTELVFSECGFPGWRAWVNGTPVPIAEAFMAFQRIPVPAGSCEVVWEFGPTGLGFYLAMSGFSLLACLGLLSLPKPATVRR